MRAHVGGELAATAGAASTLGPTVAHIAGTAEALAGGGGGGVGARARARSVGQSDKGQGLGKDSGDVEREEKEVQTVRWVLGAPKRLRSHVEAGKWEEAEQDWQTVRGLLDRWEGVSGVEKVRQECEEALHGAQEANERRET